MVLAMVGVFLTSCARVAEGVIEGVVGSATGSAFGSDRDDRRDPDEDRVIGGERLRDYRSDDRIKVSR